MLKICNRCFLEKEIIEFYKGCAKCKKCYNLQKIEYYVKNKDSISQKSKVYRSENSDKEKKYVEKNKEKIAVYQKKYRKDNKEKIDEYKSKHRKKWYDNRRKNPFIKFKDNIRSAISKSIIRDGYKKGSKTEIILGCDYETFYKYIESKFIGENNWMCWENYGKFNGEKNYGWDLDHIIPLSSAKNEDDVLNLNHFTNLQPLCSFNNRYIKRNKL